MWLECAVEETDDRGRKTRTTEARDKRRGIPQGSPISPLLANQCKHGITASIRWLGRRSPLRSYGCKLNPAAHLETQDEKAFVRRYRTGKLDGPRARRRPLRL